MWIIAIPTAAITFWVSIVAFWMFIQGVMIRKAYTSDEMLARFELAVMAIAGVFGVFNLLTGRLQVYDTITVLPIVVTAGFLAVAFILGARHRQRLAANW